MLRRSEEERRRRRGVTFPVGRDRSIGRVSPCVEHVHPTRAKEGPKVGPEEKKGEGGEA